MLVAAQGTQLRAGFRICGATTAAMHGTGTAPTPSLAPQSTGMLLVIQCPQILSVGPGKSSRLSPGWCFPHSLGLPGALLCLQQDQGSLGGCGFPPPCSRTAGHELPRREPSLQLHAARSWKEKVSVVFPLCLPGGDNLGFLESEVALGHSSACRQIKAMEAAGPAYQVTTCTGVGHRGPFCAFWGSELSPMQPCARASCTWHSTAGSHCHALLGFREHVCFVPTVAASVLGAVLLKSN